MTIKLNKFTQRHMEELETMFKLSSSQINGFDSLDSESIADILSTFNWAMHEGSATLIHYNAPSEDKANYLNFVGEYCHQRNIAYDILHEEKDNSYHLYLHQ